MTSNYCQSISRTLQRFTREVKVGNVGVGHLNPIRIQSMTTTLTSDVDKSVDQIMLLADQGCEIVRMTVQGKKEAYCCGEIKNNLLQRGYIVPLVADIHFYPPAALIVADFVDKIRINPGNFVDQRAQFQKIEYDEKSYALEIEKIERALIPLIEKCKRLKRALRIGANHGSLSDRIMNRFGNSPLGMVESALEFARICRQMDFHDLIFSMKASNPIVMIEAYRRLVSEMMQLNWDYPLHLGVTEAGAGIDGRIKSAMGIGALLIDGLGDTIRVSLTEDPCHEIDPCRRLIAFSQMQNGRGIEPFSETKRLIRREISQFNGLVLLKVNLSELEDILKQSLKPDIVWVNEIVPISMQKRLEDANIKVYDSTSVKDTHLPFIIFQPSQSPVHETRKFIENLKEQQIDTPVILHLSYQGLFDDIVIQSAIEAGSLLADRLVEGICIDADLPIETKIKLSFDILQSARLRMIKTEFISCPGCGRTRFDLQGVAEKIREKTGHLAGLKIAIMGCIVNGPGEMADADFGFVGSQNDKIDLYVNKNCVERAIDIADGPDKLVQLIRSCGKWIESST